MLRVNLPHFQHYYTVKSICGLGNSVDNLVKFPRGEKNSINNYFKQFGVKMLSEYVINNIQYSPKITHSNCQIRCVTLPREHPVLVGGLDGYGTRLLSESEWRKLGIKMSKGWTHSGYSPYESHILIFQLHTHSKE
ncbi:Cyclin-dependent kinase regulatory subunit family protein [Theileria parva strain Muguga]|uniref:Cyclin-dependent kinases regulatory subunit n=1 Tax=Theileria parva TaxID=5875 RepID=Q4N6I1_THEPA|nr:Cyclin-dependent kinase regulatory subunit family protein [Theileria parva strain Muguga]EAN34427.1 Cyclin-dependent kinase regulatory subunit family protein [Theileria parva strain Muguga]|eukprot:XP_766710.1 hypothetical protein [Theileria parva strain Muguga]